MKKAYKLVISEKPSVGKSIAAVLGANERKDGYFMGSGYIVSWCFGHLAELAEAAAYDEKYAKWRYNDLPILPESWQYSVARDKAKQLALLNTLMHREDVSEVVNACDAGREGESIFRTVYMLNKCDKTYKTVLGADVLFPSGRAVVGKCPRCGSDVTESKKGYFCERNDCHFGLWRDNRFLAAKKINLTKKMAETLLKDGKTYASGIFSEKTGKTYDAYIVLEDDGTKTAYRLEFERGKANGKQYS